MEKEEVIKVLDTMSDIPTMSKVVSKIVEIVDSPTSSATDLTKVISTDQSLAAKVLKLVNSAFYGFPKRIETLNKAIVILGFNTIRSLALSISVIEAIIKDGYSQRLNYRNLWLHALGVAIISRELAKKEFPSLSDEAFVSGLLHDIGYIILDRYFPDSFIKVWNVMEEKKCTLFDAEREVNNITHATIGMILTERWNIPSSIGYSIGFHHRPVEVKDYFQLVSIVHAANFLLKLLKKNKWENPYIAGIGDEKNVKYSDFSEESRKMLKIDPNFHNLLDEIEKELNANMLEAGEIVKILLS